MCVGDWNEIGLESPVEGVGEIGQISEYRIYWPNPCSILRVDLSLEYGEATYLIQDSRGVVLYDLQTPSGEVEYLCPTVNHAASTIRISIFGATVFKYRLSIQNIGKARSQTSVPIIAANVPCQPQSSLPNHPLSSRCLTDGVPRRRDTLDYRVGLNATYYFEIVGDCPHLYGVSLFFSTGGDGSFWVGVNPTSLPSRDDFSGYLSPSSQHYFSGSTCPVQGNKSEIWITVTFTTSTFGALPIIVATSAKEQFRKIPLSTFSRLDATDILSASSRIVCPGIQWEFVRRVDQFVKLDHLFCPSRFGEDGCTLLNQRYQVVLPEVEINPFWPVFPFQLINDFSVFGPLQPPGPPQEVDSKKYVSMLAFQENSFQEATGEPTNWVLVDDTEIHTCSVVMTGVIVNEFFEPVWVPKNSSLGEFRPSCDYGQFSKVADQISLLHTSGSNMSLFVTQYTIDYLTFGTTWIACAQFLESLLGAEIQHVEESTTICSALPDSEEYRMDPCCSWDMGWTECCSEREQQLHVRVLSENEEAQNLGCPISEGHDFDCVSSFIRDYIDQNNVATECSQIPFSRSLNPKAQWEFWTQCEDRVFGKYLRGGPACTSDQDCSDPFDYCSFSTNQCTSEDPDQDFLKCIQETIDPFVPYWMNDTKNLQLMTSFWTEGCVASDNQPITYHSPPESSIKFRSVWEWAQSSDCPQAGDSCYQAFHALYPVSDLDYLCVIGDHCGTTWNFFEGNDEPSCELEKICNVVNLAESETCDQTFCGFCQENGFCYQVLGRSDCSEVVGACLTPSGIQTNLTKEECESYFECNLANCKDCDQEACLQSGSCSDSQARTDPSFSGFCLLDEAPYWLNYIYINDTVRNPFKIDGSDCGDERATDLTTISGCMRTSFTTPGDPSTMKEFCDSWENARWFSWATNEQECLKWVGCEQQLLQPVISSTYVDTRMGPDECPKCGGTPKPFFEWTSGQYIQGKFFEVSQMNRTLVRQKRWTRVLDYNALGQTISEAFTEKEALAFRSSFSCRLNKLLSSINITACVCGSNISQISDCLNVGQFESGLGIACHNSEDTLSLSPAILKISKSSVPPNGGCISLKSHKISVEEFRGFSPQVQLTGNLWKEKQTTVYYGFQNKKKALVGKVIGHGIQIEATPGGSVSFELCFPLSEQKNDGSFSTFDFGMRTTERQVRPISVDVKLEGNLLCGNLTIENFANSSTIVPIIRSSTWETDDISLSDSEVAITVIAAILYAFLGLCSLGVMVKIRSPQFSLANSNFYVATGLLMFSIVRVIWMSLLAANKIQDSQTWDYVLIEFPSVLYFTVFSFVVLFWIFLVQSVTNRSGATLEVFKKAFFLFNVVLLILWIISVILFEVAKQNSDNTTKSYCGGRIVINDSASQSQEKKIILAYRIFLLILGFLFAVLFLVYGRKIYRMKQAVNSGPDKSQQRNIKLMAGITAIAFFLHALFLTLASATDFTNLLGGVIILMIVEIGPGGILLWLILPRVNKKGSKTGETASHSGSKGSSIRTGSRRFSSSYDSKHSLP